MIKLIYSMSRSKFQFEKVKGIVGKVMVPIRNDNREVNTEII